jgi:hypothetical protein
MIPTLGPFGHAMFVWLFFASWLRTIESFGGEIGRWKRGDAGGE